MAQGNPLLDNKQFFESDFEEAKSHKMWLDNLITTLTHGVETKPAEGFQPAVIEFEDPQLARARAAVALGLIPIDVALEQGILEDAENARRVDSLALRMRQRLYPDIYNTTWSVGRRGVPGLSEKEMEQVPSSLSGVGEETVVTPHPTPLQVPGDPLFEGLRAQQDGALKTANAEAGAPEGDAAVLKGSLPPDFPAHGALAALDPPVHTYHQVRKLIATGPDWYKDVPNIGKPTATKVEEAAAAAPVEDEE